MICYTIYKVTNTVNNKIYIGKHKTKDPYDDYIGSGKWLKRSITKYGSDKFMKEVLYIFDNKEEMDLKEADIVDEEFVARLDTYNLKLGGEGGFDYINENNLCDRKELGKRGGEVVSKKFREDADFMSRHIERVKKSHKECKHKYWSENYSWEGKKHTEESKRKIGKANSKHQAGKKNSQYGTCWIYNDKLKENKKIKKGDLQCWINKGWVTGRKIKA